MSVTIAQIEAAIDGLEKRGENIFRSLGALPVGGYGLRFPDNKLPALPKHVNDAYRQWMYSDVDDAYEVAALSAALRAWARDLGAEVMP